jgi:predicted RNase H-like nuclease (RuvC/YqgF family)
MFFNDNATHLQINIDILSEEKVNSDHKAIESAQRILDLEQQLSTSSVKFSELSLDYNRKAQAYDDAIARLEDNLAEKATLMSELEALAAQSSEKYAKFSLNWRRNRVQLRNQVHKNRVHRSQVQLRIRVQRS